MLRKTGDGSGLAEKMLSIMDFDGQRNFKYDESGPAWVGADKKSVEYDGSGLMDDGWEARTNGPAE